MQLPIHATYETFLLKSLAMKTLILFAHGKDSGPWGTKINHLAAIAKEMGAEVLSLDYSDLPDPETRVVRLQTLSLPPHDQLVLVGSSLGGYVSTVASQALKPAGLFLMAPAFYMPGCSEQNPIPVADKVCVVFGWHDEIIPVEHGIRFAQAHNATLHVFNSGHRLIDVLDQIGVLFEQFLSELMTEVN